MTTATMIMPRMIVTTITTTSIATTPTITTTTRMLMTTNEPGVEVPVTSPSARRPRCTG